MVLTFSRVGVLRVVLASGSPTTSLLAFTPAETNTALCGLQQLPDKDSAALIQRPHRPRVRRRRWSRRRCHRMQKEGGRQPARAGRIVDDSGSSPINRPLDKVVVGCATVFTVTMMLVSLKLLVQANISTCGQWVC